MAHWLDAPFPFLALVPVFIVTGIDAGYLIHRWRVVTMRDVLDGFAAYC